MISFQIILFQVDPYILEVFLKPGKLRVNNIVSNLPLNQTIPTPRRNQFFTPPLHFLDFLAELDHPMKTMFWPEF